jgi:predicted metalloendopeptidase
MIKVRIAIVVKLFATTFFIVSYLCSGRQFDKDGNMMQWWNNATIRAFRDRAQCIIDQYSRYKIDEVGLYMNGRMTQGENIADNGGLKQSFRVSFFKFPSNSPVS